MRALVTGATGFLGRRLLEKLDRPVVLSRNADKARAKLAAHQVEVLSWDSEHEPAPAAAFHGVDVVFHLAGDPVGEGRWTAAKKKRIRDSRELGTRNLVATLRQLPARPEVLISASAIGIYGDRGDEVLTETSPPGHDFLADVCQAWEREALAAEDFGMRVVTVRTGIVLGPKGGALQRMLLPFGLGLGSPLGSGQQFMSWIHREDWVELLLFAARESGLHGAVNATAPYPATNREFTNALGRALHRPTFFPPVPGFMLKLMFGEFGSILLQSQRCRPEKLLQAGFPFRFPELDSALDNVLAPARNA
jgi:uncharacterized protein (TIGR01777 family)